MSQQTSTEDACTPPDVVDFLISEHQEIDLAKWETDESPTRSYTHQIYNFSVDGEMD